MRYELWIEVEEPSLTLVRSSTRPAAPVAGAGAPPRGGCGLGGRRLARTQAGDSWHWYNDDDDLSSYHSYMTHRHVMVIVARVRPSPGCVPVRPRIT